MASINSPYTRLVLIEGGVADAHRARPAIAFEVIELPLVQVRFAEQRVERVEARRRLVRRMHQPAEERVRLGLEPILRNALTVNAASRIQQ